MVKRIPTPVVLALASAMISIGVIAVIMSGRGTSAEEVRARRRGDLIVDMSTPEAAAESFLDAWRKREHDAALELSIGAAHEAVRLRKEEDEAASPDEQEMKERVWDPMAQDRLRLQIEQSETPSKNRITLRGRAEGEFLGRPYVREIVFLCEKVGDEWKIERMSLGDILSETPSVLEKAPDPSEFEMRGEDVP